MTNFCNNSYFLIPPPLPPSEMILFFNGLHFMGPLKKYLVHYNPQYNGFMVIGNKQSYASETQKRRWKQVYDINVIMNWGGRGGGVVIFHQLSTTIIKHFPLIIILVCIIKTITHKSERHFERAEFSINTLLRGNTK